MNIPSWPPAICWQPREISRLCCSCLLALACVAWIWFHACRKQKDSNVSHLPGEVVKASHACLLHNFLNRTHGWDGWLVRGLQNRSTAFWIEHKRSSVCPPFLPQLGKEAITMTNLYQRLLCNSIKLEEPCKQDLISVTWAVEITILPTEAGWEPVKTESYAFVTGKCIPSKFSLKTESKVPRSRGLRGGRVWQMTGEAQALLTLTLWTQRRFARFGGGWIWVEKWRRGGQSHVSTSTRKMAWE